MASSATPAPQPASAAEHPANNMPQTGARWPWLKYATPLAILLLASAHRVHPDSRLERVGRRKSGTVTDDAYVRGDLTPLSTQVPGIVQRVLVADYQKVHAGDCWWNSTTGLSRAGGPGERRDGSGEGRNRKTSQQREFQDAKFEKLWPASISRKHKSSPRRPDSGVASRRHTHRTPNESARKPF